MTAIRAFFVAFGATGFGQAVYAFLRVAAATTVACWVNAGTPIHGLTADQAVRWVELGLQAGVALVLANYLGPWEKRYGLSPKSPERLG